MRGLACNPTWGPSPTCLLLPADILRAGPHGGTLWRSPEFGGLPLDECLWDPGQAPADSYSVQANCGRAAALWFCLALKQQPYLLGYQAAPTSAATVRPTERDEGKRVCTQGCTTFASIECGDAPLAAVPNATTRIDAPQLNGLPVDGCMLGNLRFCWQPTASFYCQLQGYSDVATFEGAGAGEGAAATQLLGLPGRCSGMDGKPTCTYFKRIDCTPVDAAQGSQPTDEPSSSSSVPIGAIVGGVAAAAGEGWG